MSAILKRTAKRVLGPLVVAMWLWPPAAHALPGGNLMGQQASPYLQSHAKDGVHWRPWGTAALAEAKRLKRPVFLSIGYLACHWCHVMQRESFMEGETVALINALFVPVLIDREERPDLDALYQHAANLLDLPTGWPLTMFLTNTGEPFFGATYIPKEPSFGMPGFADVLRRVNAAFQADPAGVMRDARRIGGALARINRPRPGAVTPALRDAAAAVYMAEADGLGGGFGNSAKFPNLPALMLVWRQHLRRGDPELAEFVLLSLREMVRGALRDHLGGGFFRYTTDPNWRVPHFEKMLDVNAGMVRLMTTVWRETRDPELALAVRGTVAFLRRDMGHPRGGFVSSLDADSLDPGGEELEGAYYRWREADVRDVLGAGTDGFFEDYGIAPLAGVPGEEEPEWGTLFRRDAATRPDDLRKLLQSRQRRSPPKRDGKILADANGLAARALAEAGMAFGEPDWTQAAVGGYRAAKAALTAPAGRLHQSAVWQDGTVRRGPLATLSAVTAMAHAAVSLFEATGEQAYLADAATWAAAVGDYHGDPDGAGFYADSGQAADVPVRLKPVIDDPNPSGNAGAVSLFARLYYHGGEDRWRNRATQTLAGMGGSLNPPQLGTAGLMNAADDLMAALQVVIIGGRGEAGTARLMTSVMRRSLPAQVLQVIAPGTELPPSHPARFKERIDGIATAYVCRGTVCSLPVTEPEALEESLAFFRKDPK